MKVRLIVQFLWLGGYLALAQSPGTFTPTGKLTAPREGHTATLLHSGKVLMAGGSFGLPFSHPASAELYDPATGTFTSTGNLITPRRMHTATLLPDRKVFIAGGFLGLTNSITASAELYDPSTGTFTAAGEVSQTPRQAWHSASLLGTGKVLIAGIAPNAKLYDPETGTLEDTGPYAEPSPWSVQTATLLPNGTVLITGCTAFCAGPMTQIYNPSTNTFSATGPMKWWSNVNTATVEQREYGDFADEWQGLDCRKQRIH
jgi:hypothetical protein